MEAITFDNLGSWGLSFKGIVETIYIHHISSHKMHVVYSWKKLNFYLEFFYFFVLLFQLPKTFSLGQ